MYRDQISRYLIWYFVLLFHHSHVFVQFWAIFCLLGCPDGHNHDAAAQYVCHCNWTIFWKWCLMLGWPDPWPSHSPMSQEKVSYMIPRYFWGALRYLIFCKYCNNWCRYDISHSLTQECSLMVEITFLIPLSPWIHFSTPETSRSRVSIGDTEEGKGWWQAEWSQSDTNGVVYCHQGPDGQNVNSAFCADALSHWRRKHSDYCHGWMPRQDSSWRLLFRLNTWHSAAKRLSSPPPPPYSPDLTLAVTSGEKDPWWQPVRQTPASAW